jgi:hypothetical protein
MGSTDFYLDTRNMDAIITQVQKIAEIMETTKENYRKTITSLTVNWDGKSRNMFDKKSAQLLRTLTDISQSFYDIGEELLAASQAYMEVDTQNAKTLDGNQNRF